MKFAVLLQPLLFKKNCPISLVMWGRIWKSQTTFTAFYIWGVTYKALDTFSIRPVAVTQCVVQYLISLSVVAIGFVSCKQQLRFASLFYFFFFILPCLLFSKSREYVYLCTVEILVSTPIVCFELLMYLIPSA